MSDDREGALPVLNDPQFGLTAILRPYAGFDGQPAKTPGSYEGEDGLYPVMLTEGGNATDALAGQPGYSPWLLRGLAVPFGARISIWIPILNYAGGNDGTRYKWFVVWRQRNVFDYRYARIPFHYPRQSAGDQSTLEPGYPLGPPAGWPRVVIPAAGHAVIINDPNPDDQVSPGLLVGSFSSLIQETIRADIRGGATNVFGSDQLYPLLPQTVVGAPNTPCGEYQQGTINPSLGGAYIFPGWLAYEVQAQGDEMLIGVYKDPASTSDVWAFTSQADDAQMSRLLGSGYMNIGIHYGPFPDIGVYVNIGVAT